MTALDWDEIETMVEAALDEDIGRGDLTTAVAVPPDTRGAFTIRARQPMIVAGMDIAAYTFRVLAPDCEITRTPELSRRTPEPSENTEGGMDVAGIPVSRIIS